MDPKDNDSEALILAANYGYTEIVELLIPVSDPTKGNSRALRFAALYGHIECVKLLIPVSNPKSDNSWALQQAALYGHIECVKLLLPVSDYNHALTNMYADGISELQMFEQCIEEYEALQQQERLNNKLNDISQSNTNFTKRKI